MIRQKTILFIFCFAVIPKVILTSRAKPGHSALHAFGLSDLTYISNQRIFLTNNFAQLNKKEINLINYE